MSKYLMRVNYTVEGAKGLLKDGGTKRRSIAQGAAESLGGRVEAFYFAFGDTDAYVISDMPDASSVAAMALAVTAGGGATVQTTVLMTPDEVDAATRKNALYTAPGR